MKTIGVALADAVEPTVVAQLRPAVELAFGRAVVEGPRLALPRGLRDVRRGQWRASFVLDALAGAKPPEHERLLGVTSADIFVPEHSFVFGDSDVRRGLALVSVFRFGQAPDADAFARLVASESVHQLGHTYGLEDCRDASCVMWMAATPEEIARRGLMFCDRHRADIARRLL
jgi:predicted Zn-dependent protease